MSLFPYTRARCESSIEVLEESDNNKDPAIAPSTLKDVENVSSFDIYI